MSPRGEVVLIHGFLGAPEDFAPLRTALPDVGFRTVDLLRCRARDVAALADEIAAAAIGPSTVAVLGYSLGGRIALAIAASRPGLPIRFIAVSAHPGLRDAAERERRAAADDRLAVELARDGMESFVDRWYAQPLFASLREHPDFPAIRARRLGGDPGPWAELLRGGSPGRTAPTWAALAGLGDRLAVVAGERDAKYRELAAEVGRIAPRARIHAIAGAGHAIHLERPEALAAAIGPLVRTAPAA